MLKERFYDIIRGSFFVSDESPKNWRFIIFLSGLALVMIASSHSVDKKVRHISALNTQVKELKSEYVDVRIQYMQSQMESRIIANLEGSGFAPSETPPKRIRIVKMSPEEMQQDTRIAKRD